MKQELLKHKYAYIALLLGLGLFLIVFLGAWPNKVMQRFAVLGVMAFYTLWGVITHIHTETITKRVALEYMTAALFGGTLLLVITL
jgi:hypothetical protein